MAINAPATPQLSQGTLARFRFTGPGPFPGSRPDTTQALTRGLGLESWTSRPEPNQPPCPVTLVRLRVGLTTFGSFESAPDGPWSGRLEEKRQRNCNKGVPLLHPATPIQAQTPARLGAPWSIFASSGQLWRRAAPRPAPTCEAFRDVSCSRKRSMR